jgi:hypothetical protein
MPVSADAMVKGPLVLLLALLEGRVDGDAEFFARELDVSGDMEAIVALRNALDDSSIDLPSDLAPIAGPLAVSAQRGLSGSGPRYWSGGRANRTDLSGRYPHCSGTRRCWCRRGLLRISRRDQCAQLPGLNLSRDELAEAVAYAGTPRRQDAGGHQYLHAGRRRGTLTRAVDDVVRLGADAIIIADLGLSPMPRNAIRASPAPFGPGCCSQRRPHHFLVDAFGIKRVVLPRVLTAAEIASVTKQVRCETEVFVFGGLCVMEEGRCSLVLRHRQVAEHAGSVRPPATPPWPEGAR